MKLPEETEHVVDAGQYARFLAWQAGAEDLAALQMAALKAERGQGRALATARHDELHDALDRIEAQLGVIVTTLGNEAATAAMAQMVAADVHQVMSSQPEYADLVHRLAVATIAGLETETGRLRCPA